MDLLDKRTHPQTLIVESGPFVAVALWQSARRQLQMGAADIVTRHQDDPPGFGDAVRDVKLLQLRDHPAALLAGETSIKDGIAAAARPQDGEGDQRHCHCRTGERKGPALAAESRLDPGQNALRYQLP